ncbi:MAG: electron transport complex subunit RsxC [Oscillospiraceae bacterium]|nr:electron transport complex subunit RsxC [Candidatus Equicaccousia limihippi]
MSKYNKSEILRPVKRIHGGIKLDHHKNTAEYFTENLPEEKIPQVIIPMVQHIGAPCTPTVKKGDRVYMGTKIGDCEAFVSSPIHSSVSGTVADIKPFTLASGNKVECIVIDNDFLNTPDPSLKPRPVENAADLVAAARECGLVGLGGAGFPAHVKLTLNPEKPIDTLIINAAECEPYITCDYREIIENTQEVYEAIYLIKEKLGIHRCYIAVEDNKPVAIQLLYEMAASPKDEGNEIQLVKLESRYPQGAEKMIIYTTTGRVVQEGGLPADAGCLVMNVTSAASLYRYIKTGMPLVSKRITVDGNAVKKPKNLLCKIGTPISAILEYCEADAPEMVLCGGPMMGTAVADLSSMLLKQNNAVLAFCGKSSDVPPIQNCISCNRCYSACPMLLNPKAIMECYDNGGDADALLNENTMLCMECGCCSYVCPAGRPLTHTIRLAKGKIKAGGKK